MPPNDFEGNTKRKEKRPTAHTHKKGKEEKKSKHLKTSYSGIFFGESPFFLY
jgi:hypothetical protein